MKDSFCYNMRNSLMSVSDKIMLRKRALVESSEINGFFGKKQYAAMALKALVMKFANDRCLEPQGDSYCPMIILPIDIFQLP